MKSLFKQLDKISIKEDKESQAGKGSDIVLPRKLDQLSDSEQKALYEKLNSSLIQSHEKIDTFINNVFQEIADNLIEEFNLELNAISSKDIQSYMSKVAQEVQKEVTEEQNVDTSTMN